VKNKTLAISDYITSNDFDLVALTETWLGTTNNKTVLAELVPSGYKISPSRGGGVAVIHTSSIEIKLLDST